MNILERLGVLSAQLLCEMSGHARSLSSIKRVIQVLRDALFLHELGTSVIMRILLEVAFTLLD